jgi:hypothetical protein
VKRRGPGRPLPPRGAPAKPLPARTSHSTVPAKRAPQHPKPKLSAAKPAATGRPRKVVARTSPPPRHQVARIIQDGEPSLLDLIENLLGKGVMLNADLVLALADVDLVYVRLSALLCAADRVLPRPGAQATASSRPARR